MNKDSFIERIGEVARMVGGQAELSRKTGISSVTISSYATGKSDPSRERVIAMARAAGVCVGWLAAGEGPKFPGEEGGVTFMEDPFITDIKLWLKELMGEDPGHMAWFRIEMEKKFDNLKAWREKKRATVAVQETGIG